MADKNYMNFIQCSGKILYLHYEENSKELSILLLTSAPKLGSTPESNSWHHDIPRFHVYGDKAEELSKSLSVNDRISIIGHVGGLSRNMRRQESGLFKGVWALDLCADMIEPFAPRRDMNTVVLGGKVVRVYRNADPGKKFYIPTISIPNMDGEGRASLVNFTYFDRFMALEPKEGDFAYVSGSIRTKRERENDNTGRNIVLTSIVASGVTLIRE